MSSLKNKLPYSEESIVHPDLLEIIYSYSPSSYWLFLINEDAELHDYPNVDKDSSGFFDFLEIYPEYMTNKRVQDYLNEMVKKWKRKVIGDKGSIMEALFELKRQPEDSNILESIVIRIRNDALEKVLTEAEELPGY